VAEEEKKEKKEKSDKVELLQEGYQPGEKARHLGYQPNRGNLDPDNPPHGVSGVPPLIPKASGVSEKKEEYTPLKRVAQPPVVNKEQEEKPE
jgi:hypothetical protein